MSTGAADGGSRRFRRAVLELSLKPFPDFGEPAIRTIAATLADQWSGLLSAADRAAVLLWIGDGSELLDWSGELTARVEWARWVGFNNTAARPYAANVTPERRAVPYRDAAPALDYAGVARIVQCLRSELERRTGLPVEVGATLDAGPEFAPSSFKYERHPEVLAAPSADGVERVIRMMRPWSKLHRDVRPYAGYPHGIPEGLSFGTFLGRQTNLYLEAMGFDYLWLSNGLGFSTYAWTAVGEVFDGARFHPERASTVRARVLDFWRDLGSELRMPVEVRGTNFTTGMDIGSDAVPAREITRSGVIRMPPPNSPWGPLNRDFAIELTGYLSRIAELPDGRFPFRFYANDPWFWQSPWRDFYGREPFDIRLPLAMSRLADDGSLQVADDVEILTVDTERGELDGTTAREVTTHIRRARESAPDAAAPFVWLYPYDEYHDGLAAAHPRLSAPWFEDGLATAAVAAGLPLATVVSTRDAPGAGARGALDGSTVLVPASGITEAVVATVQELRARGIDVIVYGSLASSEPAARLIGLAVDADGSAGDLLLSGTAGAGVLRHRPELSDGSVRERLPQPGDTRVLATVTDGRTTRPYLATVEPHGSIGRLSWIRGSSGFDEIPLDEHGLRTPRPVGPGFVRPGALLRDLAGLSGWTFGVEVDQPESPDPVRALHRHDGALWLSASLADTTVRMTTSTPWGAPVAVGHQALVEGRVAVSASGRTFCGELRVFVTQARRSVVAVDELAAFPYGTERLLAVRGLHDAELVLHLPTHAAETARVLVDGVAAPAERTGTVLRLSGVSGRVEIGWPRRADLPAAAHP